MKKDKKARFNFIIPLLICGVFIALSFNTGTTNINQRLEIIKLQNKIEQEKMSTQELSNKIKSWEDTDFVKREARVRLNYAMPNEKVYSIIQK